SAPSFTTVKYWVAEFKRGRTSCQDEHRSGRPNELKVRELADMVGISKSAVHRILTDENLDMRKMGAAIGTKTERREDVSIECLA
ncbi:hypothetical protein EAI_02479, partial [Harpegnathos saltator]